MTRRWVLAAAAFLAACSENSGPGTDSPIAVAWMEWPTEVTAVGHGTIRIVGYHGVCGTLQIEVAQSGPSSVSVEPVEHFDTDPPPPCPASVIGIFDTVLPLPRLVTPAGPTGTFTVDAPAADPLGGLVRRAFGFVRLTDQPRDTALQVGGRALVKADSLGCSWARPEFAFVGRLHVLSSDLTLGDNAWHGAFISGAFSPALSPRCGQDPLLNLRLVEVDASH